MFTNRINSQSSRELIADFQSPIVDLKGVLRIEVSESNSSSVTVGLR